jgi:hypothetical protein
MSTFIFFSLFELLSLGYVAVGDLVMPTQALAVPGGPQKTEVKEKLADEIADKAQERMADGNGSTTLSFSM